MKASKVRRRPVMLLEVLIAFALVALCVLPLIYPHVFILRSEKKFTAAVELDHFVNLLFADRLQRLYQNEISWGEIESGKVLPVDESLLRTLGYDDLPFTGNYQFEKKRQKISKDGDHGAYLFDLVFTFTPKKGIFLEKGQENYKYSYEIALERKSK